MTIPELVDPQLAAFWASDPSILHPEQPPATDPDAGRREHVRREIAASIVVMAGLVARELLANRPDDPTQATATARSAWSKHAPMWLRLVVPAIRRAYELGRVKGLTGDELQAMAEDYAATLGDYLDTSSADALADGFNAQLNAHWSESLAWHRAASGYGMDGRQMRSWIKGLMNGSAAGRTDPVPQVARALADKALLVRADRIGADESYAAGQSGLAISWLYLLRAGKLPDTARRQWNTAEDEAVCALCAPLDGAQARLDEPFVLPDGTRLWAPRAHPGCYCGISLIGGEVITKSDAQPRDGRGRWVAFDDLEPHEQRAAALYSEQMIGDGAAAPHMTPRDYRYELRHEPLRRFIARYMDADDTFKAAYGPGEFAAHHRETLSQHVIPRYPAERRWPLIVNDANPNYVDDGYHRLHSYIRDGVTHIPVMRMRPASGDPIAKAAEATVAGLCLLAADTARVLMLQRADDPNDPAGGMWEFPGGHVEDDEVWLGAAKREWAEEVRQHVPDNAKQTGSWQSGIYRGFVLTIPHESEIQTHKRGRVRNPDDPDCDEVEAIAWWDVEHLAGNPAVRPELRASLAKVREAIGSVSKNAAGDPYNRDAHGEFAHVEGRRLALRPAVLEPDPAIDALLAEIEQGTAAAAPSLLAKPESLLAQPSLLSQSSLLGQESLLKPGSLLKPDSLLGQESLLGLQQKAPARRNVTITIKLPAFPPRPDADPDPFYLPYAHMRWIEYDGTEGQVDYNTWFMPGALANFSTYNASARFQAENAEDDSPRFAGDWEDEDAEEDVRGPSGANLLHAQRASGFRHLTEIFNSEQFDFWNEIGQAAIEDARSEARDAVEDVVFAGLKDSEIDHIFQLAGYDRREPIAGQRQRIVDAVQHPKADRSLASAYADYVAHVRPELVNADTCRNIAEAKEQEGIEVEDAPISQIFVFDKGLHSGDVPDDRGQVLIDHDYVVDGVEYVSADEGIEYDSPVAAYRLVYVSPE